MSSDIDGTASPELPSPIDIPLPRGEGSVSCCARNLASLSESASCTGLGGEPPRVEELPTSNKDLTPLGPSWVGMVGVATVVVDGCVGGASSLISSLGLESARLLFNGGWEAKYINGSLSNGTETGVEPEGEEPLRLHPD